MHESKEDQLSARAPLLSALAHSRVARSAEGALLRSVLGAWRVRVWSGQRECKQAAAARCSLPSLLSDGFLKVESTSWQRTPPPPHPAVLLSSLA